MTGYLPYLIKKNGYTPYYIGKWIESHLNKHLPYYCMVTYVNETYYITVKWLSAYYIYIDKFKQLLGVPVHFDEINKKIDLMFFKIYSKDLKKYDLDLEEIENG